MKKRVFSGLLIAAAVASTIAATGATSKKSDDPVIMTVNGNPVTRSEFTYLYNKNNSQQMSPQSVDDYLDMFVVYKLKVADALANGVDTTQNFMKEYNKYRNELAAPYLTDQAVQDSLVNEAFSHQATQRDVNYIMMFRGRTPEEEADVRQRIDSIRTVIVNGDGNFAALADQFSVDKNHGHMGLMPVGRLPYEFEKAVYDTPVGVVSEVKELPFGFFIVRVDSEQPNPGQVQVRHILKKFPEGVTPEQKLEIKAQMDSIYNLLVSGAVPFHEAAMRESQDPSTQRNGGLLQWFGPGMMVKEFEDVSFALKDGEISQPFETRYGYHIAQRVAYRAGQTLDELRPALEQMIERDYRANMATDARLAQYKKQYKATIDRKVMEAVRKQIAKAPGDSTALAKLATNNKVVAKFADQKITVAQVMAQLPSLPAATDAATADAIYDTFSSKVESMLDDQVREYAIDHLSDIYPDYRNLMNEYRDGMLLFEVSDANVWGRSTRDVEGLENYFNTHRGDYTWKKPHFKGYVVFASNDSIGNEVQHYLNTCTLSGDDFVNDMKTRFGRDVKVERVLAEQGENAIIDNIAFGGPLPEKLSKQWPVYYSYQGEIIEAPQEAADVRGQVTADYQQVLEAEWVDALRAKYPVVINYDVVKTVK